MTLKQRSIPVALIYDFDGTLAPGNMQERDFIPALGIKPDRFWKEVKDLAKKHDMDEILAYLNLMLKRADEHELQINRRAFEDYGKRLKFFPGVEGWFGRINRYGEARGVRIKHFIISSGLREMILATRIARHFEMIFASGFRYDQHDVAIWPALAVNYTNKAQFLFRINKGIKNSYDNSTINKVMALEDRPMPFKNMIYIGDGETDVPAMKMTAYQGGLAIAVYPKGRRNAKVSALRLVADDRVSAAYPADYREKSALDRAVKAAIDQTIARYAFEAAIQEGRA